MVPNRRRVRLFTTPTALTDKPNPAEPLAARMRPRSLEEVAGQQRILAPANAELVY